MGTFLGHIIPGTFFMLFSSWWAWAVFHRYFICQREFSHGVNKGIHTKHGRYRYKNTCSYVSVCCSKTFPVEGFLKVVATVIGMLGEFATGFDDNNHFYIGNGHHMTMFFFFGLTGVVDIFYYYGFPLPPGLDYITGILAFGMEGTLFYYHLHGRSSMSIQMHMLIVYLVVLTVIACTLELYFRYNVIPAICRIYLTLLQGTWFYQIGFILHPPYGVEWDQENPEQMMTVILIFAWHNAAIFFFLFILGTIIYFRVKSMDRTDLYQYIHPFVNLKGASGINAKINSDQTKSIVCASDDEEEC